MFTDEPAVRIAWKIRDIHHRHTNNIHGIIARYGLHSGQPRILRVISEMNGATQNDIAQQLETSPASLAMSIKRMQKADLLRKVSDEKDLRVNKIHLTDKGREIQQASLAEIIEADKRLIVGFTPEEIAELDNYLDRIYQNLEHNEGSFHAE